VLEEDGLWGKETWLEAMMKMHCIGVRWKMVYIVSLEVEGKKELNDRIVIQLHALVIVFFQCITYLISKQYEIYCKKNLPLPSLHDAKIVKCSMCHNMQCDQ
jgi:hypothetical protein